MTNRDCFRKILIIVFVLSLTLMLSACSSGQDGKETGENLLKNGDFSAVHGKLPADWQTDAWYLDLSYTEYELVRSGEENCAHIINHEMNDARFRQKVRVEADSLYLLHGFIRVEADENANGKGANLSIGGLYAFSQCFLGHDGEDDWHEVSYYGRTGPEQTELDVFVRLGGYSGETKGEAWFKDISLVKVEEVPADAYASLWYDPVIPSDDKEGVFETDAPFKGLIPYSLLYLLAVQTVLFLCGRSERKPGDGKSSPAFVLSGVFVMLLGIAVRMIVAVSVNGYDVDIGCFTSWMNTVSRNGFGAFYENSGFCDYPPGYIAVLRFFGLFGTSALTVKLPSVFFDALTAILIFVYGRRFAGDWKALSAATLYILNPVTVLTGAGWGQSDAAMTALLALCVLEGISGRWYTALPAYTFSVLMKPQALMFGPLGLTAFAVDTVMMCRKKAQAEKRKTLIRNAIGVFVSVLILIAVSFLFRGGQDPLWLLSLYEKTMGSYSYTTVNACNGYFLFGQNWQGTNSPVSVPDILLCGSVYLIPCVILTVLCFRKIKKEQAHDDQDRKRLIMLCGAFFIIFAGCLILKAILPEFSVGVFGTVMTAVCTVFFCAVYLRQRDVKNLPLLGAGMLVLLFNTASMMHERYMFPALLLLTAAYLLKKDKRIVWLMAALTVFSLLNIGSVLDRNIRIGGVDGHLNAPLFGIVSDMKVPEYLSAVGNVFAAAFTVYLCLDICILGNVRNRPVRCESGTTDAEETKADPSFGKLKGLLEVRTERTSRMNKKDVLIVIAVTAAYAALTFTNLGSLKAPQTGYISRSAHEEIVFDLGEEKHFKLLYYSGIQWEDEYIFTVETGNDQSTWSSPVEMKSADGDCFRWQYALGGFEMTGRYIRIDTGDRRYSDTNGLSLMEFVCRDAQTGESIPMTLVSGPEGSEMLCDEPYSIEGEPGWRNGTYFDEIYHARTAYEHLHGLRTYETSHPPLGKVIMSLCVAIFGMTPFGWRFAGAACGVLMLPAVYMLARLMIRKRKYAYGAIMVFALDLMHFTQTRIATIDSFVVLFILWSLYFMVYWIRQDYFGTAYVRTFVPLALSGLFMGLSVASKWTGCYNGVGLAVLFFGAVYIRFRQAGIAGRLSSEIPIPPERTEAVRKAKEKGRKMLLGSIGSCAVFFIAVPALIYYLSYIPYFRYIGGVSIRNVIEAAEGMLAYHSQPGLGMDHYFYSPWYEWPLDIRPMWYYSDTYSQPGFKSTIMCMGNPAVWWGGLLGLLLVIVFSLYPLYRKISHRDPFRLADSEDGSYELYILILMFAAQFLPWVPVPRGTYIYHYFACVPVIILCLMKVMDILDNDRKPKDSDAGAAETVRAKRRPGSGTVILIAYIAVCAVLFILFFPYASGITAPVKWLDAMKWFPSWLWY